jgi:prepilin-type N-terminal cleavage/methylation domain-containing protein
MTSKNGFTLVEILVVMTLLAILAIASVSAMDPMGSIAKARDAQRKKDLDRIKIAMEDYYGDRNCFPDQTLVISLNDSTKCGSNVFAPWLSSWPCDPKKLPYSLVVGGDDANCPKWYKVMTFLENKKDPQIFDQGGIGLGVGVSVNYGVSSGNVSLTQ